MHEQFACYIALPFLSTPHIDDVCKPSRGGGDGVGGGCGGGGGVVVVGEE